jgi:hypothetical protein
MQRNCCCNEKIDELRNLLIYSWLKPSLRLINIKHYSDSAQGKSTVQKWFAKLARSGRPKEVVTDENIKKVHNIILNDRKVKLIEIAVTLKISKKRVGHSVHEYMWTCESCVQSGCRACSQSIKSNNVLIRVH